MRVYVPAAADDLRRLEHEGSLADDGRLPAGTTVWLHPA